MTTYEITRTAACPHCGVGKGFPCRVGRGTKAGFVHPRRRDAAETIQPAQKAA